MPSARPRKSAPAPASAAESPLLRLYKSRDPAGRPYIGDEQFAAGERLRRDYERACLERRITASWDQPVASGGMVRNLAADLSDGAIAARERYHRALEAAGPEFEHILVHVCCLASGLEQAERLLSLPPRAGKAVLALALARLARHYGFVREGQRKPGRIGHWALEGYRPGIVRS